MTAFKAPLTWEDAQVLLHQFELRTVILADYSRVHVDVDHEDAWRHATLRLQLMSLLQGGVVHIDEDELAHSREIIRRVNRLPESSE